MNLTVKIGADGSSRFGRDHYQTGLAFGFPAIDVNNPPTNVIQQTYNLRVPLIDNAIVDGDRTLVLYLVIGQVTYAPTLLVHTLTIVDDEFTQDIFRNGFETALVMRAAPGRRRRCRSAAIQALRPAPKSS